MGVPPLRLAGWEPQTRTTHIYDRDGLLVESVTRTDPEWDLLSVALMTIWRDWKAGLCHGCGRPYESHLGETADDYVGIADTCPALEAVARAQKAQQPADERTRQKLGLPKEHDFDRFRFWYPVTRAVAAAKAAFNNMALKEVDRGSTVGQGSPRAGGERLPRRDGQGIPEGEGVRPAG